MTSASSYGVPDSSDGFGAEYKFLFNEIVRPVASNPHGLVFVAFIEYERAMLFSPNE